jgi:hypothetical protein
MSYFLRLACLTAVIAPPLRKISFQTIGEPVNLAPLVQGLDRPQITKTAAKRLANHLTLLKSFATNGVQMFDGKTLKCLALVHRVAFDNIIAPLFHLQLPYGVLWVSHVHQAPPSPHCPFQIPRGNPLFSSRGIWAFGILPMALRFRS